MIRRSTLGLLLALGLVGLLGASSIARASGDGNAAVAAATAEVAATPSLEDVMARLARSGGVEARFHESRRLELLTEPIESAGMLYFRPPDWLARHVTQPGESRVVVRDDRVLFRDETGEQTFDLGSSEVARSMVGNVMVLMRGDLEGLRAEYSVGYESEGDRWVLDLEPKGRIVRSLIERLRVEGRGEQLVRMESRETNGDVTLTTFSQVRTGVDFSEAASAAIFSTDAPEPAGMKSDRIDRAP